VRSFLANVPLAAITLSTPLIVFGNAVILLLFPWMGDLQYALPGFPDDPLELKGEDRARLAEDGIRSIWPFGPGAEILRDARLPGGERAFTEFEISHMEDVRALVRAGLSLWLVAVTAAGASLLLLCRRGRSAAAARATRRGALLTILLLAACGIAMLVAYEAVFDGFHALFFPDGTWSFADRYTLRRIYPDAFWTIASAAMVLFSLLQVAALFLAGRRTETAAISSGPATP
jgi:integral membrane protein (TIGR01906 family)